MKAVLKTAPTKYPVELKAVKEHLNITVGWTEDDDYIKLLIKTATKKAEQYLRRKLIYQAWYAYYDAWPSDNEIIMPFGQLQDSAVSPLALVTITYTDTASSDTVWSTDEYNVDTNSDPGRIVLEYGYSWPTANLHPQNPIVIEFVCGYGDAGSDVEDMITHAIKLIVDDLYNNRGDILVGISSKNLKVAGDLLMPYRLHERPTQ